MFSAVFFDVDGTLYSHEDNVVPTSTIVALEQLKERGVRRVIATGRHMVDLEKLPAAALEMDAYICLNGQLIFDAKRQLVWGSPLEQVEKEQVVELFESKTIPMVLLEEKRSYLNVVNERVEKTMADIHTPVHALGEYEGADIYQAIAFVDEAEAQRLKRDLADLKITSWHPAAIDIVSASASKAAGLAKYMQLEGISAEDCIAFGDGENDIEMLRAVGLGIAMGNAVVELKAVADLQAERVNRDGIYKSLLDLGLCD